MSTSRVDEKSGKNQQKVAKMARNDSISWCVKYAEYDFLMSHHKDTQNSIQGIVPILRFLLLFRGIFALSRHKNHIFDRRSTSSDSFCAFGG
ncbi:MAG: hypothetical protein IJF66_00770 [Clostridia bacterium]|nr:hypothetical protein [Clostridia bacterium]